MTKERWVKKLMSNQTNSVRIDLLRSMNALELLSYARERNIELFNLSQKIEIIRDILDASFRAECEIFCLGILEALSDGFGFIRMQDCGYVANLLDVYLAPFVIKKFGLQTGDELYCSVRAPREGEKYFTVIQVLQVHGVLLKQSLARVDFDDLTPVYPTKRFVFEQTSWHNVSGFHQYNIVNRCFDIITPLGMGNRCLVIAPPKIGKTSTLHALAKSITQSYEDVKVVMLLIDERPEEVTDAKEKVPQARIISSTFDEHVSKHVHVAAMALQYVKSLVTFGHNVFLVVDSLTRLVRANNVCCISSGKVLTGGVDPAAMGMPKKLFGAARATREGGSLTIVATLLTDTGSKMDELIYAEMKGTGNSDYILNKERAEQGIFPAISIKESSTRKAELLFENFENNEFVKMSMAKKMLLNMQDGEAFLIHKLNHTSTNWEVIDYLVKQGISLS